MGRARSHAAIPAALLLVAGVFAGAVAASPSGAAPPSGGVQTTVLELSDPTTNNTAQLGAPTGAAPAVLAQKDQAGVAGSGTPILFDLSVLDGSELNKGTVVVLEPVKADLVTSAGGTFTPSTFIVPARGTSFPVSVTYSKANTDVVIKASLKKSTSIGPGFSAPPFDVVDTLRFAGPDDETLATGFGASDCTSDSTARVCGFVVLSKGIASTQAAVSNGSDEAQFLAGLGNLYVAPATPATFVLRCDKAYCKGKGVTSYTAKISLVASADFINSPACITKGVLNTYPELSPGVEDPRNHFCTDYAASHRDNAGDLLLEVLFDRDMKGTM
jgi:hypothetical protein